VKDHPLSRKRSITVELGAKRRQLIWDLSVVREAAVYPVAAAPTRAVATVNFLIAAVVRRIRRLWDSHLSVS